jgi:hypothetical protein
MLSTSKLFKNPVSSGPVVPPTAIELLVVGPGGSGTGFAGTFGSPGGAGGIVYYTAYSVAAGTSYSWLMGQPNTNSTFGIATAGTGGSSSGAAASSGTGATALFTGRNSPVGNNYTSSISGASVTYATAPGGTPGGSGSGSRPNPGASPPGPGQAGTVIVAYPTTFSAAVSVTGTYTVSTTARPGFYVYTLGNRFTTSNGGTIRW